ncbi:transposase [Flavobacterium sp.]|jgi:putative transposase|uniref:transposase n=1 Tax=Flavobacterium sp. TaxID=239 RepID=UPI0037BFEABF
MKLEILAKDHFYHIYNRGINSEPIFLSNDNKLYFLKLFSKYMIGKIAIYAYCLMDNHFHIVIKVTEEEKIVTQSLSNLFNSYAKAFNKQNDRTGSLFEKHFKRIVIQDENYLRNIIQYVHLNPKNHLDLNYKTYKYSSFQALISDKETKLAREEVLSYFDSIDNFIYCHDFKNEILSEKFTFE